MEPDQLQIDNLRECREYWREHYEWCARWEQWHRDWSLEWNPWRSKRGVNVIDLME